MPGAAVAVGADRGVHQRLAHPVALDGLQPAGGLDPLRGRRPAARRSRRRAGAPGRPRRASAADALEVGGEPVVHRRHAEQHRRAAGERLRRRLGGELAEVPRAAAAPQRAEHAEDQPVHVEQRQPVRDDVLAGPLPGVGERVEVRGERAARQHDALRRAGRPGRVDDDRGRLVVGLVDGQSPDARRSTSSSTMSGRAVGQDVLELALARLRVDRDDRHARRPARRPPRRTSRASTRADHRHARRAGDPLGHRARRRVQLLVAQRVVSHPDRLAAVGLLQTCQEHDRSSTPCRSRESCRSPRETMPGTTATARPRRRRRTREPDARQRPADPAGVRRRSGGRRRGRRAGRLGCTRST